MSTLKIYGGWDNRQEEAADVFKFSVLENASIEVEVESLKIHELPLARTGVTGFTYSRWLAPWLNKFEGVVLVCDACDQLCLGDVAELAEFDMQGKPVCVVKHPPIRPGMKRARSWSSVMLMDCAQFGWLTPDYVATAADSDLMLFARLADDEIGDLPPEWNTLIEPSPRPLDARLKKDSEPRMISGLGEFPEPQPGTKLAHWSALSNPNMGNWIEKSGSAVWAEWRERWRTG